MSSIHSSEYYMASARVATGWQKVYTALVKEDLVEKQKKDKLQKKLKLLKLDLEHLQEVQLEAEKAARKTPWYMKDCTRNSWIVLGFGGALTVCAGQIVDSTVTNSMDCNRPVWLLVLVSSIAFANLVLQIGDGAFSVLEGYQKKKSRAFKKRQQEYAEVIKNIRYHLSKLLKVEDSEESRRHMVACIDNLKKLPPEYIQGHKEIGFAIGILLQLNPDSELKEALEKLIKEEPPKRKDKQPIHSRSEPGPISFLRSSNTDKNAEDPDFIASSSHYPHSLSSLDAENLLKPLIRYLPIEEWNNLVGKIGTSVESFQLGKWTFKPEPSKHDLPSDLPVD